MLLENIQNNGCGSTIDGIVLENTNVQLKKQKIKTVYYNLEI